MSQPSPLGQVDDFIRKVNAAKKHKDVFAALSQQIQNLGFEYFTYKLVWLEEGTSRSPLYYSNYPSFWVKHYDEKNYHTYDMVCCHSAQMMRPFLWEEATSSLSKDSLSQLIMNEASEAGLKNGCSIPLHGPGNTKAHIAIASNATREEFTKLFMTHRHVLLLVATYAHEAIVALRTPDEASPPVSKLKPREIEVLTLTAQGKTAPVIADILSLSEDTIKEHIGNACQKLGVYSKVHAASIAITRGLIAP